MPSNGQMQHAQPGGVYPPQHMQQQQPPLQPQHTQQQPPMQPQHTQQHIPPPHAAQQHHVPLHASHCDPRGQLIPPNPTIPAHVGAFRGTNL